MEETDGTVTVDVTMDATIDGAHRLRFLLRMLWYSPMLAGRLVGRARTEVDADVDRWITITALNAPPGRRLVALLATYPEFRTLYCYRLRRTGAAGAALSAVLA